MNFFKKRICDNCGKKNPPVKSGTRITTCCTEEKVLYKVSEKLRSNGKATTVYLKFPIRFEWRGFWNSRP